MGLRRYNRTPTLSGGKQLASSEYISAIRENIANGNIKILEERILQEKDRLDIIAGEVYNDGTLWWIIASASNIGWFLQCPPGTRILIPDLESVSRYVG